MSERPTRRWLSRRGMSRWLIGPRLAQLRDVQRPSGRTVERAVRWLILFAAVVANLAGAVAVFVLSVWILPTDQIEGDDSPILVNLGLAGGYLLLSLPVGMRLALRRSRPGRTWLREGRAPTPEEQRNLLRAPLHVLAVIATLWLLAAVVFGAYNATFSLELGQRVAVTVALGGLTTCAVAYLLSERLLRPAAARALAARPLERPALPGVTARTLFAWGLGSGIPLIGLSLVALSALTEGDFSRDELAIAVLAIAAAAFVVGFFAIALAARVTADPIVAVRRAVAAVEQGNLDAEVPVYDGTEVGLLQSGFNSMVEGLREREHIREVFGMHVGEKVAREALERGEGLGGEEREVAVLFVDMVASTEIASTRPPEEVVELLNEFFGIVVDVVDEHGGWVNKFEGDAALAIFGAPEALPDAAARALSAARALAERLAAEIERAKAGVGVSFGRVVAGNIGGRKRFEYTVIGDAVNEAARLTELAKSSAGGLLASARAVEAAGSAEAERWSVDGEVELRGRPQPTRVARPVGTAEPR